MGSPLRVFDRREDRSGRRLGLVQEPWFVAPVLAGLDPERDAKHILEKTLVEIESEWPGLSMTSRLVEGNPCPILSEASKDASMLVVGRRGLGEFAGMLLGSVSQYCVTHADCPVLVYRDR